MDAYIYSKYLMFVHFFAKKRRDSSKSNGGLLKRMNSIIVYWVFFISYIFVLNTITYEITKPLQRICIAFNYNKEVTMSLTKTLLVLRDYIQPMIDFMSANTTLYLFS